MGELAYSHLGQPIPVDEVRGESSIKAECLEHNLALLRTLRADEFAAELFQQTVKDAEASRMTKPEPG